MVSLLHKVAAQKRDNREAKLSAYRASRISIPDSAIDLSHYPLSKLFSDATNGMQKTLAIRPCQKFQGHTDWVKGVIHLLGGRRIMTYSSDGSLRVWDLKTGEQIGDAWQDGGNVALVIALSLDGKKAVCGCEDGAVRLRDIDTSKIIAKWTGHTNHVSICVLEPRLSQGEW